VAAAAATIAAEAAPAAREVALRRQIG